MEKRYTGHSSRHKRPKVACLKMVSRFAHSRGVSAPKGPGQWAKFHSGPFMFGLGRFEEDFSLRLVTRNKAQIRPDRSGVWPSGRDTSGPVAIKRPVRPPYFSLRNNNADLKDIVRQKYFFLRPLWSATFFCAVKETSIEKEIKTGAFPSSVAPNLAPTSSFPESSNNR